MIDIRLYKPQDIDIQTAFPSEWNECTLAQLHLIARCIFIKPVTQPRLLIEMLRLSIQHSHPYLKPEMVGRILTLINIEDLAASYSNLLAFIFESVTLTEQRQAFFGVPNKEILFFYGPKSSFEDLTVGEFEDADHCFGQWQAARKAENTHLTRSHLAHLVAILYRPYVGSVRQPYTGYDATLQLKHIGSIGLEKLYTVLLWYMGCKALLPKMFPLVYNHPAAAPGDIAEPDPMAITRLIHHGAGPKNGTRDDIRRMRLHEFLFDLNLEAEKDTIGS